MGFVDKLLGVPSERKQAAMAASAAKAPDPAARSADSAKEDTGAVIKESDGASITNEGTDVGVTRSKKTARKGVPGLGL